MGKSKKNGGERKRKEHSPNGPPYKSCIEKKEKKGSVGRDKASKDLTLA